MGEQDADRSWVYTSSTVKWSETSLSISMSVPTRGTNFFARIDGRCAAVTRVSTSTWPLSTCPRLFCTGSHRAGRCIASACSPCETRKMSSARPELLVLMLAAEDVHAVRQEDAVSMEKRPGAVARGGP